MINWNGKEAAVPLVILDLAVSVQDLSLLQNVFKVGVDFG